jgi:hypothetical protein
LHPEIPDDIFLPEKETEPFGPEAAMPEADEYTPESYDKYIIAEVMLPVIGGELEQAKVTARKPMMMETRLGEHTTIQY